MKITYKNVNKNNITTQQNSDMLRLDDLMFESYMYKSLGSVTPSNAILAYNTRGELTEIVGKVNINIQQNKYSNITVSRAQISNLAVLPYVQKNGIGSTLISKAENLLKELKVDYAYLNIDLTKNNAKKLIRFYSKNGFILPQNANLQTSKVVTMLYPVNEQFSQKICEKDLLNSFTKVQKRP